MSQQLARQTQLGSCCRASVRRSSRSLGKPAKCVPGFRQTSKAVRSRVQVSAAQTEMDKMRAAEQRWEEQVRQGKVKNVSCTEVGELLKSGWVLLDVRPPKETARVPIIGSVQIPLFVEDKWDNLSSIIKHSSSLGMGGWWIGGVHMIPNQKFLAEVQAAIPKDAQVVVGCQKGLRSLAACEQLSRAGYQTLAWVNGGFETAPKGALPTKDGMDIRYAGIGGASELLGWTEVQQQAGASMFGGYTGIIKLAAFIVALDGLLFAYEFITAGGKP